LSSADKDKGISMRNRSREMISCIPFGQEAAP